MCIAPVRVAVQSGAVCGAVCGEVCVAVCVAMCVAVCIAVCDWRSSVQLRMRPVARPNRNMVASQNVYVLVRVAVC